MLFEILLALSYINSAIKGYKIQVHTINVDDPFLENTQTSQKPQKFVDLWGQSQFDVTNKIETRIQIETLFENLSPKFEMTVKLSETYMLW